MPKTADRVRETTTTTGTGTVTLAGAVAGFQAFASAFASGDRVWYAILSGSDWETGVGTLGSGTLARTQIAASSNAGAAITLVGTSEVFCTAPSVAVQVSSMGRNVARGRNWPMP